MDIAIHVYRYKFSVLNNTNVYHFTFTQTFIGKERSLANMYKKVKEQYVGELKYCIGEKPGNFVKKTLINKTVYSAASGSVRVKKIYLLFNHAVA